MERPTRPDVGKAHHREGNEEGNCDHVVRFLKTNPRRVCYGDLNACTKMQGMKRKNSEAGTFDMFRVLPIFRVQLGLRS